MCVCVDLLPTVCSSASLQQVTRVLITSTVQARRAARKRDQAYSWLKGIDSRGPESRKCTMWTRISIDIDKQHMKTPFTHTRITELPQSSTLKKTRGPRGGRPGRLDETNAIAASANRGIQSRWSNWSNKCRNIPDLFRTHPSNLPCCRKEP